MAKYTTLKSLFTAIANSLRTKTNTTGKIVADDFPSVIDGISVGVEGGIIPTGTKNITSNGTHDVKSYANAEVNVPVGVTPSGTKSITANGTHDVTNYASANVNVPIPSGYIKPSGSINITANGTHTVTNYASAVVDVPVPAEKVVVRTITISSDITNTPWNAVSVMSGDSFIKAHYSDPTFSVTLIPTTQLALSNKAITFVYHGNCNIGASDLARYGVAYVSTGSTIGYTTMTAKVNGEGYTISLRVDSSGNLKVHTPSNYTFKAGTYTVILQYRG